LKRAPFNPHRNWVAQFEIFILDEVMMSAALLPYYAFLALANICMKRFASSAMWKCEREREAYISGRTINFMRLNGTAWQTAFQHEILISSCYLPVKGF
jgi:hypothetical protein